MMSDVPVRGRRMVVASRHVNGRRLPLEATVEPEVVVASSPAQGIGALVEAVVGGLHDKLNEITRVMSEVGTRPVVLEMPEHVTAAITAAATQGVPEVIVNVPPQPTPIVNITMPEHPAPQVTVNVPEQPAPVVTVEAPNITVEAAPAPVVEVTVEAPREPNRQVTFQRDRLGEIVSAEIEEG